MGAGGAVVAARFVDDAIVQHLAAHPGGQNPTFEVISLHCRGRKL